MDGLNPPSRKFALVIHSISHERNTIKASNSSSQMHLNNVIVRNEHCV